MRFGLDVAQQRLDFDEIVDRVRFGEDLGFDGVWGFDHFRPMYGRGPGNCFEGMTTLATLAGHTSRIRLGLLVAGVTYRHLSILSAEAVTIDHASNGRLELGIGAAWYEREHRQLGVEFPPVGERFDRLEDQLEIFVRLFTGEVVSYQGHQISLTDAQLLPMPIQQPHPPIWIGGTGPKRTIPLVARFADMWHVDSLTDYRSLTTRVDELASDAGRDPAVIGRAATLSLSEPLDEVRRNADAFGELGMDYLVCSWPDQGRHRIEEFWTTIAPDLA